MSRLAPPTLLSWHDYRRELRWGSPDSPDGPYLGRYPKAVTDRLGAQVLTIAPGRSAEEGTAAGDIVLVGLEGDAEVCADRRSYSLGARDVLLLPAGTGYRCANVGLGSCLVFAVSPLDSGEPGPAVDVPGGPPGRAPHYSPWREARLAFEWRLPWAAEWGYHRAAGPHVSTASVRGHWALLPAGQQCRWHSWPQDVVYVGVDGEFEFVAAGERWRIGPSDILVMPAGVPYIYANHGLADALFYDIGGPVPPGTKSVYYAEDPGWPVDPAAPLLGARAGG